MTISISFYIHIDIYIYSNLQRYICQLRTVRLLCDLEQARSGEVIHVYISISMNV